MSPFTVLLPIARCLIGSSSTSKSMDAPKLLFVGSNYDHLDLSRSTALLSSMQDTRRLLKAGACSLMASIRLPAPMSPRKSTRPPNRLSSGSLIRDRAIPSLPPTFVVSGAGELPEGILAHEAIIRVGDTSSEAMIEKASFVMDLMETRLHGLGADWCGVTDVDIYTVHALEKILPDVILKRIGTAGARGVRWFFSRPPIEGIEFEMDLRGVRTDD